MTDTTQIPPAAEPNKEPSRAPYWFPDTRSLLAVGTMGCVFAAAFTHLDPTVFTAILPLGTLVLGWYFGSSKGSEDKNALLQPDKKGP